MDVILNFAALRSGLSDDSPALTLASGSDFQRQLADAAAGDLALASATSLARDFARTGFVRSADEAAFGAGLLALLERLRDNGLPASGDLREEVRQALNGASSDAFAGDAARARDSVVARYLLDDGPPVDAAQSLVRAYSLAAAVLAGTPTKAQLKSILRGPMALPDFVLRLRNRRETAPPAASPEQAARALAEQINALAERRKLLSAAREEITLHAEDELVLDELGERRPLNQLHASSPRADLLEAIAQLGPAPRQAPAKPPQANEPMSPLLRASTRSNVRLSSRGIELTSEPALHALGSLGLDPAASSLRDMHRQLSQEHQQVGQQLMTHSAQLAGILGTVAQDGGDLNLHLDPSWILDPVDAPEAPPPVNTTAPTSHAAIKPLGVADLLLVRAHISHYERAEVAAIENVLAREKLTHTLRRLDASETTRTEESESTDLRSQTQSLAEQESGTTTVPAVGPSIGPLTAQESSSFARSVTDQVSASSSNRRRRVVAQRELREREETVEHQLDNLAGDATSYGVYQWLDKVYTAQIFAYGSRLLYDLIVPEPAAVFREALARPRGGLPLPVRPAPFTLAPTRLSVDNWAYYVAGHHASGVEAPPPQEVVVTEFLPGRAKDVFSTDSATNTFVTAEGKKVPIPKGYRAGRYRMRVQASGYDSGVARVTVGTKSETIAPANGTYVRYGRLDGEVETLPVGILVDSDGDARGKEGRDDVTWGIGTIAVGVEIVCEATEELFTAWQVKAHGQILEANRRRFEDYEERVANRDAAVRIFLQSLSPERKASLLRTEMKRAALEVLTAQSFSGFNTLTPDAAGFPFPNPAATVALSPYIRFFESAIEWEHLAYAFYPYFWGAQASWLGKLLANDGDSPFGVFLTSGASRVILPIRPGFEAAFERFLNTGTIPTTDQLLSVGSALWVSLVDELRRQSAENGQETPVDEPWQFRIASDLVRARPDGSMPKWTLAQGKWSDAADPSF